MGEADDPRFDLMAKQLKALGDRMDVIDPRKPERFTKDGPIVTDADLADPDDSTRSRISERLDPIGFEVVGRTDSGRYVVDREAVAAKRRRGRCWVAVLVALLIGIVIGWVAAPDAVTVDASDLITTRVVTRTVTVDRMAELMARVKIENPDAYACLWEYHAEIEAIIQEAGYASD